jgi:hypothetical protein
MKCFDLSLFKPTKVGKIKNWYSTISIIYQNDKYKFGEILTTDIVLEFSEQLR